MARGQGWVAAFFSAHVTLVNHFLQDQKKTKRQPEELDTHDLCWKPGPQKLDTKCNKSSHPHVVDRVYPPSYSSSGQKSI